MKPVLRLVAYVTCCLVWWTQQGTGALQFLNNFICYVNGNICQDLSKPLTSVWQWTKFTSRTNLEGFIYNPGNTKQHCTCPAKDHKQSAGSWQLWHLIMALISTKIAGWLSTLPLQNDGAMTVAVKVGQLSTQFITGLLAWQCVNSLSESSV